MIVKCINCNKDIYRKPYHIKRFEKFYCSRKCRSDYMKKIGGSIKVKCASCNKSITRTKSDQKKTKSGNFYCSPSCRASITNSIYRAGKRHPRYVNGNSTYRKKALDHYGEKCSNNDCEIESAGIKIGPEMLEVHHIDGNRKNSDLKNLMVLCVWCHKKIERQGVV